MVSAIASVDSPPACFVSAAAGDADLESRPRRCFDLESDRDRRRGDRVLDRRRSRDLRRDRLRFLSLDRERLARDRELSRDFFDFSYDRDRDRFLRRSPDLDLLRDRDLDLLDFFFLLFL